MITKKEKEVLLQSNFGQELQRILKRYYEVSYLDTFNPEDIQYDELLTLSRMALNFMYHDDFVVELAENYYGICSTITGEYLIKETVKTNEENLVDKSNQEITQSEDQSLLEIFNKYYENLKVTPGSVMIFWKENKIWKGWFLHIEHPSYKKNQDTLKKLNEIREIDINAIMVKDYEFAISLYDEFMDINTAMKLVKCNYEGTESNISQLIRQHEFYLKENIISEIYRSLQSSGLIEYFVDGLIHPQKVTERIERNQINDKNRIRPRNL